MNRLMLKIVIAFIALLAITSSSGYAIAKQTNIVSIDNINITIYKGVRYELPAKVKAKLKSGSYSYVPVKWSVKKVDTNKLGKKSIYGTVSGYKKKIVLNINIIVKPISVISVEDIKVTVYLDEKYQLPKRVQAVMSDFTIRSLNIIWNENEVNTSEIGEKILYGTVKGLDEKVKLKIQVIPHNIVVKESEVVEIRLWGKDLGQEGRGVVLDDHYVSQMIKWVNDAQIIDYANLPPEMPFILPKVRIYLTDKREIQVFIFDGLIIGEYKAKQKDLEEYLEKNKMN